jgi:hypothetical protein
MTDDVTEEMIKAADKAAWAYDSDASNDPLSSYGRMRAALTAACAVDPVVIERDALANEKRVWQTMILPQMRSNLEFMEESRDEWRQSAADVSERLAAMTAERDDLKFSCDHALIEISRLMANDPQDVGRARDAYIEAYRGQILSSGKDAS